MREKISFSMMMSSAEDVNSYVIDCKIRYNIFRKLNKDMNLVVC